MSTSATDTAEAVAAEEHDAFLTPAGRPVAVRIWPSGNSGRTSATKCPTNPATTTATGYWDACARIPWAILLLSAVQCAVFVFCSGAAEQQRMYFALPARSADAVHSASWWRYLSYSLVHVSFVHVGINVALQLLVGVPLETEQGRVRLLAVYVAGVYGGALAAARWQPQLKLAGASAGVFGLLLSHVPHTAMNFHHLPYRYFRLLAIVVLCVSDGLDIGHLANTGQQRAPTANPHFGPAVTASIWAHMGGAIAGTLAGTLLYTSSTTGSVTAIVVVCFRLLALSAAVLAILMM